MDLSRSWKYIEYIARQRLKHNQTKRHVTDYGTEIEIIGAAGELAARQFLGLSDKLHVRFDQGVDIRTRSRTIDVKATRLTPLLRHRYLQWPLKKPVVSDIVLLTAINVEEKAATIVGYATRKEIQRAPINRNRSSPCREIAIPDLHDAWELELLTTFRDTIQLKNLSAYAT
jgi:hypothetical protein